MLLPAGSKGEESQHHSFASRLSVSKYLSAVGTSSLLASICLALDVPMSAILREVSVRFEMAEGLIDTRSLRRMPVMPAIPDTVPELLRSIKQ